MLVPQSAIDILEENDGSVSAVVRAGIKTKKGFPVSVRRAQEWKKSWSEGTAESYEDEFNEIVSKMTIVEKGDTSTIEFTTDRVTTLDELIKSCEIDTEVWDVEKCELSRYETARKNTLKSMQFEDGKISGYLEDNGQMTIQPMTSIKVWLKKRPTKTFEDVIEKAVERLRDYAPKYISSLRQGIKQDAPHLFVPSFFDPHFNNLSVDETHTVKKAADEFKRTADNIVAKAESYGMAIERILLPAGNDALHIDNLHGTTTKGTPQEMAGDPRNAVDYMCDAYIHLTEGLSTIAPVDVIIVPGNHDQFVTYFLGKYLEGWFHRHPDVYVDTDKASRKYYRYGSTMMCMEHGDKISPKDMAGIMATECPEYFVSTKFREVWRGHLHTEKTLVSPLSQQYGVMIRYMPSMAKTNRWHSEHGYVNNHRGVEGMYYSFENGPAGIFPIFLD